MEHHQPALVAVEDALYGAILVLEGAVGRIEGYLLLGQFELKL